MQIPHCTYQILLLVCLLLFGCGQNKVDKTSDIPVIDIVGNLGNYEAVPVSQYITELEYIPLETNDNCLIGELTSNLLVTSTHIFVLVRNFCYAFNHEGQFLGQIGNLGQGPGEFSSLAGFSMDEKKQYLYLETYRFLLEYSWDGVFRQSIDLPKNIHGSPSKNIFFVRDNLFIGHFSNQKGDLFHNFILFDQSSEVVKLFDNYVQFYREREMASTGDRAMRPYRIGKHIYVKEISNDTLFCLNEHNELIPQLIFDLGEYASSKEKRERHIRESLHDENIRIPTGILPMVGIQNHIFFSLRASNLSGKYSFPKKMRAEPIVIPPGWQVVENAEVKDVLGIYDKATQDIHLLDTDPISRMPGLINDLDGGLSFWPRYYTSDNELVDIWRAEDIKEYLTEEYFAAHEIRDPAAHQKLKNLVQKLDEEDNPVVVIAKLKPN